MKWLWNHVYSVDILFLYFVSRTMHKFKIPAKYLFTKLTFNIIWNSLQVSMKMSIVVKPWNLVPTKLNDFTAIIIYIITQYFNIHNYIFLYIFYFSYLKPSSVQQFYNVNGKQFKTQTNKKWKCISQNTCKSVMCKTYNVQ